VTAATISGRDPSSGASIRVTIEQGRIAAIDPAAGREEAWLAPGLIDLQVNGFAGHDLNAEGLAPETVAALAGALLAVGVTRFAPTLITASEARITANLAAIAAARDAEPTLRAMIPYVHVEGPHIAAADGARGAHPREWVRPCDPGEFVRWQEACGGLVGMVTVSPHDPAAFAYIAALSAEGVHVAIGHTDATAEQIHQAAVAGATLSTHLGNAAPPRLARHPNLLWAQLADDRLTATFIADGHHLPADTLSAMIRAKGLDRSILVSDTAALGGMPPGAYETPVGGRVVLSDTGRLGLADSPYLAGAATPLKDSVARAARDARLTLAEALQLAAANPARIAGGGGVLAVGAPADLIRFDWQPGDDALRLDTVLFGGVPAGEMRR